MKTWKSKQQSRARKSSDEEEEAEEEMETSTLALCSANATRGAPAMGRKRRLSSAATVSSSTTDGGPRNQPNSFGVTALDGNLEDPRQGSSPSKSAGRFALPSRRRLRRRRWSLDESDRIMMGGVRRKTPDDDALSSAEAGAVRVAQEPEMEQESPDANGNSRCPLIRPPPQPIPPSSSTSRRQSLSSSLHHHHNEDSLVVGGEDLGRRNAAVFCLRALTFVALALATVVATFFTFSALHTQNDALSHSEWDCATRLLSLHLRSAYRVQHAVTSSLGAMQTASNAGGDAVRLPLLQEETQSLMQLASDAAGVSAMALSSLQTDDDDGNDDIFCSSCPKQNGSVVMRPNWQVVATTTTPNSTNDTEQDSAKIYLDQIGSEAVSRALESMTAEGESTMATLFLPSTPYSMLFYPVYDSFPARHSESRLLPQSPDIFRWSSMAAGTAKMSSASFSLTTSQEDPVSIVGVASVLFSWTDLLRRVASDGAKSLEGVICVIQPTINDTTVFSYRFVHGDVEFLGVGDMHDEGYTARAATLQMATASWKKVGSSPVITLYPSADFDSRFVRQRPWICSGVMVFLFLFATCSFVLYDCLVENRQTVILKAAHRTGRIVNAMFPKRFRDRLFKHSAEQEEAAAAAAAAIPSSITVSPRSSILSSQHCLLGRRRSSLGGVVPPPTTPHHQSQSTSIVAAAAAVAAAEAAGELSGPAGEGDENDDGDDPSRRNANGSALTPAKGQGQDNDDKINCAVMERRSSFSLVVRHMSRSLGLSIDLYGGDPPGEAGERSGRRGSSSCPRGNKCGNAVARMKQFLSLWGSSNDGATQGAGEGDGNNNMMQQPPAPTGEPIADLFPQVTILFADMVGFTAWSSAHEPHDVFYLLETLFWEFDVLAMQHGIFKLGSVGDCYIAVAGLLDYHKDDHAVALAQFAEACRRKTSEVSIRLSSTLGPDTAALSMRFGMHSGAVTAGVLRGHKSRFELFGDTINTASRMESTSLPNRIQVSADTAQLICESGQSSWLTAREEGTTEVKGKGLMKTFWLAVDCDRLGPGPYYDDGALVPAHRTTAPTNQKDKLSDDGSSSVWSGGEDDLTRRETTPLRRCSSSKDTSTLFHRSRSCKKIYPRGQDDAKPSAAASPSRKVEACQDMHCEQQRVGHCT